MELERDAIGWFSRWVHEMTEQRNVETSTPEPIGIGIPRAAFGAAPMSVWSPNPAISNEVVPASRGSRFCAKVLDTLITSASVAPGIVLEPTLGGDLLWIMAAGYLLTSAFQWYMIATRGQSIGKRLLRIKIQHSDGAPVGFLHGVVLREWAILAASLVPIAGRFVMLADALSIFRRDRKCLHDLIAGTEVVCVPLDQTFALSASDAPTAPDSDV